MVFNVTMQKYFRYIVTVITLVEETGIPGENHRPVPNHRQALSHNAVSSTPRHQQHLNSHLYW